MEIRILWGATLLAVQHLDPPRSFSIGDAGSDFALRLLDLENKRIPLLLTRRGGLVVIAPPGASATIRSPPDQSLSLAAAISAGLAAPHDGDPGAHAIPLAPGLRVSLALSTRPLNPGYRTTNAEEIPSADQIVFEISTVRAGGRVGRGLLRGKGRLTAILLVTTALAAGALGASERMQPPWEDAEDKRSFHDAEFAVYYHATLSKNDPEEEESFEREPLRATGHYGVGLTPPTRNDVELELMSAEALLKLDRMELVPGLHFRSLLEFPDQIAFPSPIVGVRDAFFLGGMGLPGIGEPLPSFRLAGQGPSEIWREQYSSAARWKNVDSRTPAEIVRRGPLPYYPPPTPLRITVARTTGSVSEHVVLREIRERRRALQGCADLLPWTIHDYPYVVFFNVGTDGVASIPAFRHKSTADDPGTLAAERELAGNELTLRCIAGALDGLRFASSETSRSTFEITVALRAAPAPSSRP